MLTLKYRPFSFNDIVGQKGIISEMKKRSLEKNFPEVMIFEGESGTGKTTLAFIISALLNDKSPIDNKKWLDPNPESDSCKSILEERFNRDVSFFDASSMGKDDVLKLEYIINTSPMFDENRVIIIDEAQELSKAGKGVTLKLLEKKRKNAFIILCTMDINAFDKAVRSRGQLYTFRSPNSSDIAEYLFKLTMLEKSDAPESFLTEGLFTIAENCEGSVRMAVQSLERCLIGNFFTEEEIKKELGLISNEKLANLIIKILNKDSSVIKEILDFSAKEFYYKANKTLVDSFIYNKTGYISAEWKESFAKKLSAFSNFEEVTKVFLELSKEKYFRDDLFLYELSKILEVPKKVGRVKV